MGYTIEEIVEKLKAKPEVKISNGTVYNDLKVKQKQIEKDFANYIEKDLPIQHNLAVTGLDKVIKEAWRLYQETSDKRAQLVALTVIADATMKKQAVLGDPAQIEKAIKTVAQIKKQIETSTKPVEPDVQEKEVASQ